jgi:hypothetical protein
LLYAKNNYAADLADKHSRQAVARANFVKFENPENAPVFFLDGPEHSISNAKLRASCRPMQFLTSTM